MAKKQTNSLVITIIAVSTLALAGLSYYALTPKANKVDNSETTNTAANQNKPTIDVNVTPKQEEPTQVQVLVPQYDVEGTLSFDRKPAKVPRGQDPVPYAINQYLEGLSFVPVTARALSITVQDGQATIDFDPSIDEGYGTEDEQTLIVGILTVAGQFEEIKTVKFLSGGKDIEGLGNIGLLKPQPVIR